MGGAYQFGTFRLDPDRCELLRLGERVPLEPQVFQPLVHLVRHRDRMVSKDDIVAAVWDGRAISDASISSRVRLARSALGDDGTQQAFIRTVHGRGFRFVAPVVEDGASPDRALSLPVPERSGLAEQGKPSIAVLPLQAIGLPLDR